MDKLTPTREAALRTVASEKVTRQGFPLKGSPYYLVNSIKDTGKTATFDFLRRNGYVHLGAPSMRGTTVLVSKKGQEYLAQ